MAARGVSVRGSGDTRTPHKPEGILVAFLFLYWFGMVSLSPYCVGMSFWVTVSMRFVYKPSRLMTTFLSLCQCTSLQQESCTYCRILTAALWVFFPPTDLTEEWEIVATVMTRLCSCSGKWLILSCPPGIELFTNIMTVVLLHLTTCWACS